MDDWDELETLLDDFEERRAAELEARRKVEQGEARFRGECVEVLRTVVIPTFEAAGRSLSKRAHECTVTRRIADYDVPSADLTVRPYLPEEKWVRRSRLSMRCDGGEGFVVSGEVSAAREEPVTLESARPLADVDEGFIREKVVEFVRAVLDEH